MQYTSHSLPSISKKTKKINDYDILNPNAFPFQCIVYVQINPFVWACAVLNPNAFPRQGIVCILYVQVNIHSHGRVIHIYLDIILR